MSNRIVTLCCLCVALYAGAIQAQAIPGIDTMPRAQARTQPAPGPNTADKPTEQKQPETEQPAGTENRPANTDSEQPAPAAGALDDRLPLIRNLRVEKLEDPPHSVRVSWEVDPANDTSIYVGRYVRPTASRELLLEAESLASPPLGPKETSFVDRNIPDGAYYYVVVTVYEVSRGQAIRLVSNTNYTTTPMIINRSAVADSEEQRPVGGQVLSVRNLSAVNAQSSVKLNWSPANAGGVVYNVYRSLEPLSSPLSLRAAQRLGQTQENRWNFEDEQPPVGRVVYYGVTVTDAGSGQEYQQLSLGQSYVQNVFRPTQVSQDRARLLPDALTAYLENRNTVKLLWVDPSSPVSSLRVYRSNRPITSAAELERATPLGEVARGVSNFRDINLSPGVYYYALVPRNELQQDVAAFVEGRTFTGFGARIQAGQSQVVDQQKPGETTQPGGVNPDESRPYLSDLRIRGEEDAARISWRIVGRERAQRLRLLLYRSTRPLRSWGDVRNHGDLLAEVDDGVSSYTDGGLPRGRYYYALSLEADGRGEDRLLAGRNFVADAVVIGDRGAEETISESEAGRLDTELPAGMVGLNRILKETYFRRDYGEAVRRIAPYVVGRGVNDAVRARAMLYTGMSYYHMGQYRSAMEFFLHERVRRSYPERARFWYNRSLERSR